MSASDINASISHPHLSHNKQRCFKPEKLSAPRDFIIPEFVVKRRANEQGGHAGSKEKSGRPLVVEIGAGKGMHACLYAKKNPEQDLIAIERTQNKFSAFRGLVQSVNSEVISLDNLLAVHADAIPYCVHALPAKSVAVFYILYPNPEPKNPNQQWLNMPFFEFLLSRLQPEGKVILASNIEEYIEVSYDQAVNTWCLPTTRKEIPIDSKRTHFEIKYLARGESCWELEMTKPEGYVTRFDSWHSPLIQTL